MDPKYEKIRHKVMKEKTDLEIRLKQNDVFQLGRSERESDGELSSYDNHPADTATTLYEREKDIALLEHEKFHLDDLNKALNRLEEGTYGICKRCGKEIDYERLEAIPTAVYCIDHQLTPEYTSERPVEEEVLTSFGQFDFDGRDDETEFDAEDSWQAVARFNELQGVNYEDIESDEQIGSVEPLEGFIITDMDGNVVDESIDIWRNRAYEDYIRNGQGYGVIWEEEIVMPDEEKFK